jgi:hypothetical protein
MLAIILPWFIAVEQANPGFWHYFIVNEHLDRLLDRRYPPDYEVSKISAIGYLVITACWCFPWILFLPSVIKSAIQEWQRGFLVNASLLDRKNSDGIFLLATAAILPVVLFLPLSSRLIYYSIPTIPPYIMLCAGWWSKTHRSSDTIQPQHNQPQKNQPQAKTTSTVLGYSPPQSTYPAPICTLCKSSVQVASQIVSRPPLNLYGAIALLLGVSFYGLIAIFPVILPLLPSVLQTHDISRLMIIVAIALGTGWLASGTALVKRSSLAWLPLVIVLTITYLATIKGFVAYEDIRSSKNLVHQANACLSIDTLWIYEGSREIGAAGAISYYLNQTKVTHHSQQETGWTNSGNLGNSDYRTVMGAKIVFRLIFLAIPLNI